MKDNQGNEINHLTVVAIPIGKYHTYIQKGTECYLIEGFVDQEMLQLVLQEI